jgi:predicted RND superfamily exporter protein
MDALAEATQVVEAVHVLSFPFLEVEGVAAVEQDIRRYGVWAAGLILLVLALTFRSPVIVFTVLLWEAVGMGLLVLSFHLLEQAVDVYTGILFPLIGGLQLTFVVHYICAFQREARRVNPQEAARIALREVLAPSALAGLTSLAGLATLYLSDLPSLQAFGRVGMLAVILVFLGTFLLPVLVGFRKPRFAEGQEDSGSPPLRFGRKPAWCVLFLTAVGVVSLVPHIQRIRTDIRAVEFIRPGHPIRESVEVLNRDLGGTNIFQLQVHTGTPRGLQSLPVLEFLEELRAVAMSLDGVTDAYAYSQLYMGLNQIWQGGDRTTATLPTSPAMLGLFSRLLNASPLLFEDSFVNRDASSSILIIRSEDMPAQQYLHLLKTFLAEAERRVPEGITLEPLSGLHTILEGDRKVVQAQTQTLLRSMGIVALLLAGLWWSLRLAAVVLLANVPALVTIFGGMGLTGYPLNSVTVMVAAVILGIAVDDGIHLVGAYRGFIRQGMTPDVAAGTALKEKWRPMTCTSAILAVFLGLLIQTSFPPVAHFGVLGALGIAAAWVGALLLLPALLVLTRPAVREDAA